MIKISLPDSSSRSLPEGSTVYDLAANIGPGLAKAAVAAHLDGTLVGVQHPLHDGAQVRLLTKTDKEAIEVLRHSAAHMLADATLRLFPQAQLTIGPVVEDGFYYDFYMPEGAITSHDFPAIEQEMAKIAKEAHPFVRETAACMDLNDPVYRRYQDLDKGKNTFKQEIVTDIQGRGEALTFYQHGNFIDLCRGPHVPHTGWLKNVKLTKIAGAYWRGDSTKPQLTRLYGTAFFDKADLEAYLHFLEEAKKRDHRVLGEKLDLFSFHEEAPGFPFFHGRGTILYNLLADHMRRLLKRFNYIEVKTPIILSEKLWHTSGHYDNYLENMFFTKLKLRNPTQPDLIQDNQEEERPLAVKPMNCPGHCVVYRAHQHSHHELPLRFAEMGLVHRRELSGVRHGLFRVQSFTQDDGHHFCTTDQIGGEIQLLITFFHDVYKSFGLDDVRIEFSTRPSNSIGTDEVWEKAESALKQALDAQRIPYEINPGDGAFYGPKIDFHIRDTLKRSWQCGTIQLDFSMPERFGLSYIGADGQKHTPVMIHKACYGSMERFIGILIEHYAGAFPLWLSPVQVHILPISDKFIPYAQEVQAKLQAEGFRCEVDMRNERIGYKIRDSAMQRFPYAIVVGQQEMDTQMLNIRKREQTEQETLSLPEFVSRLQREG